MKFKTLNEIAEHYGNHIRRGDVTGWARGTTRPIRTNINLNERAPAQLVTSLRKLNEFHAKRAAFGKLAPSLPEVMLDPANHCTSEVAKAIKECEPMITYCDKALAAQERVNKALGMTCGEARTVGEPIVRI